MDLEAIKARVEAAPPGPWKVVGADNWRLKGFPQVEMNTPNGDYFPVSDDATAQFIAHARTDVPDLLARVARLERAIQFSLDHAVDMSDEYKDRFMDALVPAPTEAAPC